MLSLITLIESREVTGDEITAVGVGAGVVNQQAHVKIRGQRRDAGGRVALGQIDRQCSNRDPALFHVRGGPGEGLGLPGDQNQIHTGIGQFGRKCPADLRSRRQ